jgi:hypothetical protein
MINKIEEGDDRELRPYPEMHNNKGHMIIKVP